MLILRPREFCFGGGGGGSAPTPTPPPAPAPTPVPTAINPVANATDRAKNLASYQYGLASTIKTGASGITGSGPELRAPAITGANKTGSAGAIV
jgi:hypothetical protein